MGIRLSTLVRRLRDGPPGDGCSDADLLARFARTRDDAAFELLVWRHGAMVLGTCRRVLGHTEDAEDAFQAAFLVLARKAAGISRGVALPAWLHRVAVRIALRLTRSRRPTEPLPVEPSAQPQPDRLEQAEELAVLDQEIDRLPERCRRAVVLCYLEGLTAAEAARQLGCPTGTVESRLAAARKRLRDRLTRRGVTLPAGVLAVLTGPAGSLAPAAVARLARAAGVFSQSESGVAEFVNESSVRLAKGVLTMSSVRAWAAGLAVVAAVSLLTAGVVWANRNRPADPPNEQPVAAAQPPAANDEQQPADPAPGDPWPLARQIPVTSDYSLVGVSADGHYLILRSGQTIVMYNLVRNTSHSVRSPNSIADAALSPDGKLVATAEGMNGVKLRELVSGKLVEAFWPSANLPAYEVAFSPDGSKLIALCLRNETVNRAGGFGPGGANPLGGGASAPSPKAKFQVQVSVWDLATKKELGRPAETIEVARDFSARFAADGRFVMQFDEIVEKVGDASRVVGHRVTLIDPITGTAMKPTDIRNPKLMPLGTSTDIRVENQLGEYRIGGIVVGATKTAISADGKSILACEPQERRELVVVDATTGKEKLRLGKVRRPLGTAAFSPDGTRIAAATGFTARGRGPSGGGFAPRLPDEDIAAPTEVVIWDAATGKELARLSDKETSRNYRTMRFSPDGSFLAVQDVNGLITIWGRPPKPEPAKPKPAVGKGPAPAAGVPERFQSLIRDLSADGVSDQKRVESLFLATLGRLPTDTEARALTTQLARETDKAAGLRDLLNSLVDTAEFKTHAAALQQLMK